MGNKRIHRSIVLESREKIFYLHNVIFKRIKQLLKSFFALAT